MGCNRENRTGRYITLPFIIAEGVMFCLIFFSSLPVNLTSYLSILICFIYALLTVSRSADRILLCIGLAFTLGADTHLVLLASGSKVFAVCLFIGTQTAYLIRLIMMEKPRKLRASNLLASLAFAALAAITAIIVLKEKADSLSILSTLYYALLISNVVYSYINFKSSPFFALGLTFFAVCDFIIGMNFMYLYMPVSEGGFIDRIVSVTFNLAWVFYLPSQVMIACSAVFSGKRNNGTGAVHYIIFR